MGSNYHVVKFKMIEFDKNWTCKPLSDAIMEYTALEDNASVNIQADSGAITYKYHVRANEPVYVIGEVIHISARSYTREE